MAAGGKVVAEAMPSWATYSSGLVLLGLSDAARTVRLAEDLPSAPEMAPYGGTAVAPVRGQVFQRGEMG
jgi:hypothetical protein